MNITNTEQQRLLDNSKMKYIHACKTCKLKNDCPDTNNKTLTCEKYWADLNYESEEEMLGYTE
jgi:hypothetical protein